MFEILYGTENVSKFRNMKAILEGLPIKLLTDRDACIYIPPVIERGQTPLENAREKATSYYRVSGMPSMGLDSGLYFEGLPEEKQPGVFVRRVNGRTLSDEEVISYYSKLSKDYGGALKGRFINGISVIVKADCRYEEFGPSISTDSFIMVDNPCSIRRPGFPMDSLAIDPETGKYWAENILQDEKNAKGERLKTGFRDFFTGILLRETGQSFASL